MRNRGFTRENRMNKKTISVVIPAYNEGPRIKQTVREVYDYFTASDRFLLKEIIVVDDGSDDGTGDQLAARQVTCGSLLVLRNKQNQGKGAAVKRGVQEASGDTILFMDADLSTPLRYVDRLFDALEKGADIAIGSRALKDSKLIKRQPFYRELSGRLFNLFVQVFFTWGIWDTQCGFKLFRPGIGRRIFSQLRIKGFAFDVEFLHRAKAYGCTIAEVPVEWIHGPDSKVKMLRDPFLMIRDLLGLGVTSLLNRLRGTADHAEEEALRLRCKP